MKKSIVVVFLSIIFGFAKGQEKKATIVFEEEMHDFGSIKEEEGAVNFDFKFKNKGNFTLLLRDVKSSCGCATPTWDKKPIPSGDSSIIKVSYDTKNRPGNFSKAITVNSNAGLKILTIQGIVIPRPKTNADIYPSQIGHLRMTTNHMAFQNIKSNEVKTDTIKIFNEWDKPMTFSFEKLPDHLKLEIHPATIESNKEGLLIGTYDAKLKKDFGFLMDGIVAITNDSIQAKKTFSISANIEEFFASMTKEDSVAAPKIEFKEKSFNYGKIKQGDTVHHEFVFINTGKKDLLIRKTKASCGCTISQPDKTILKAGESANIKVDFNSAGKHGKDTKSISVISNDPTNPSVILTISGEIEAPEQMPADTGK